MVGANAKSSTHASQRLRQLLDNENVTTLAPGVYDGITARLALAQGYDCLYMTGAGTSLSRLGMADLGLTTMSDMLQNAAMLTTLNPDIPIIADADTGYGGPNNIANLVWQYARAGVAGLHIEDQVVEKRCGHLEGKELVTREIFASRLRAACQARDSSRSGIVIIARTDARAGRDERGQGGFQEAIERLQIAADIGVDALFFEAPQSVEECKMIVEKLPRIPLLLNMVSGGKTPIIDLVQAQEMGFRMIIWPLIAVEATISAVQDAYAALQNPDKPPMERMLGPRDIFELFNLSGMCDFDEACRQFGRKFNAL